MEQVSHTISIETIDKENLSGWEHARGNPKVVIKTATKTLEKAQEIGYDKGIAWATGNLGAAHMWNSNYEEALKFSSKSQELLHACEEYEHESEIYYNLSGIYYFIGDDEQQIHNSFEALRLAKKVEFKSGMANAYNAIGLAHYNINRNEEAIENLMKGAEIAKEIGDRFTLSRILDSIGNAYYSVGDYDKSLSYELECLEVAEELGQSSIEAYALHGIGQIYLKKKEFHTK